MNIVRVKETGKDFSGHFWMKYKESYLVQGVWQQLINMQ